MKQTIIIVEDEPEIGRLIEFTIEAAGYRPIWFDRAEPVLSSALRESVALFLLDVMLPDMDGLELCRKIRAESELYRVPVIVVSAKTGEEDRLQAFANGADDYLTKPFSPRELVARVAAHLRRASGLQASACIRFGHVEIDSAAMLLRVDGKEVRTTALEFRLLEFLARSPGLMFSREHLLQTVWGRSKDVNPRSVDVYISKLREKIEKDPDHPAYLLTGRGVGYRLQISKRNGSNFMMPSNDCSNPR